MCPNSDRSPLLDKSSNVVLYTGVEDTADDLCSQRLCLLYSLNLNPFGLRRPGADWHLLVRKPGQ